MIHFFTDPYENELLYSAIARYHFYTGNVDFKDTLEECFESRNVIPSLEIGGPVNTLGKNIGGKYDADFIINKHTIFPYYALFLPEDRRQDILSNIKYKNCSGIYAQIGIVAGSICEKDGIYYCPLCSSEEIEQQGEAYIHREHQLQGIYQCVHHKINLKKYRVSKVNISRLEYIRLDKNLLELNEYSNNIIYPDIMQKLSRDAYYLLNHGYSDIYKDRISEKYKNLLYERGLTTSSMRVKQHELYQEFSNFYSKELLSFLESSIDEDNEYNWLKVVTRNSDRTVHPIRHLLLINFLQGDISRFLGDLKVKFNPFGNGPWPCLNKVSVHYKANVINNLKITEDYKTRLPVGTFSCECGFVYSRKGPDKTEDDRYRIGRIKSFGSVWEDKLYGYLKEHKYGLRELARLMNCDLKTILKFDALLGINYLNYETIGIDDEAPDESDDAMLEVYKKTILDTIADYPEAKRSEIRNRCKKEYIYIYRKNKKWLDENMPEKTKIVSGIKKVDWNKRDSELLSIIKVKHVELLNREIPTRVTISLFGKELGILSEIEKNIDKLPATQKYLSDILETVQQFQMRRCKIIIQKKIEAGEQIRLWEIQRLAGIRSNDFRKIIGYIKRIDGGEINGESCYQNK